MPGSDAASTTCTGHRAGVESTRHRKLEPARFERLHELRELRAPSVFSEHVLATSLGGIGVAARAHDVEVDRALCRIDAQAHEVIVPAGAPEVRGAAVDEKRRLDVIDFVPQVAQRLREHGRRRRLLLALAVGRGFVEHCLDRPAQVGIEARNARRDVLEGPQERRGGVRGARLEHRFRFLGFAALRVMRLRCLLHGEAQLGRERFGALERRRKDDLLGERFQFCRQRRVRPKIEPREHARRRAAKAFRLRDVEAGTKRALVRVSGEHVVDRGRGRRRGERGPHLVGKRRAGVAQCGLELAHGDVEPANVVGPGRVVVARRRGGRERCGSADRFRKRGQARQPRGLARGLPAHGSDALEARVAHALPRAGEVALALRHLGEHVAVLAADRLRLLDRACGQQQQSVEEEIPASARAAHDRRIMQPRA